MKTKLVLILAFSIFINCYSQSSMEYIDKGLSKMGTDFGTGIQDYQGAIADFSKAIEINPKNEYAYFFRGLSKALLFDYRGAIADYSEAIEINPNSAGAYHNRGLSKISLGQKESGCLDLSKAEELGYAKAYERIKEYCN